METASGVRRHGRCILPISKVGVARGYQNKLNIFLYVIIAINLVTFRKRHYLKQFSSWWQ